jgi:hypothetical protein
MEPKQMLREMIEFNRTAFDNTFEAITKLQEQMEKMTNSFMDQTSGVPKECKKALEDWISTYKKGREGFKKNVDDQFEKVLDTIQEKKGK